MSSRRVGLLPRRYSRTARPTHAGAEVPLWWGRSATRDAGPRASLIRLLVAVRDSDTSLLSRGYELETVREKLHSPVENRRYLAFLTLTVASE